MPFEFPCDVAQIPSQRSEYPEGGREGREERRKENTQTDGLLAKMTQKRFSQIYDCHILHCDIA